MCVTSPRPTKDAVPQSNVAAWRAGQSWFVGVFLWDLVVSAVIGVLAYLSQAPDATRRLTVAVITAAVAFPVALVLGTLRRRHRRWWPWRSSTH